VKPCADLMWIDYGQKAFRDGGKRNDFRFRYYPEGRRGHCPALGRRRILDQSAASAIDDMSQPTGAIIVCAGEYDTHRALPISVASRCEHYVD
jgi:hypothetical protein